MLNTSSRKRLRSLRAEAIQIEDDPRAFGENTPESDAQEAGMPGTRGGAEAAGAKQARRRATGGLTTDRRSRHNAVERKRQQQLSSYISELGEFLEEHGVEVRRDKVSILTSLLKFLNGEDGWRGVAKEEPTDGKFPLAKGVDFSALFAYHTSPMLVTEPHGRVVACNEAFCHTFDTTNEVVTRGAAALNILHAPSSEEFQSTLSSIASLTGHRGHGAAIGEPSKPRFGESMDVQRVLVVPTHHGSYMEAPVTMRLFVVPAAGSEVEREKRAIGATSAPEVAPTDVHIACVLYGASDPTAWAGGSASPPAQPAGVGATGQGADSPTPTGPGPAPTSAGTAPYSAAAAAPATSAAPPAGLYARFGVAEAGLYGASPSTAAFRHHADLAAQGGHPPYGGEYAMHAARPPAPAPYPFAAMGMAHAPQASGPMPVWHGQRPLPVGHQPYLHHHHHHHQHQQQPQQQPPS